MAYTKQLRVDAARCYRLAQGIADTRLSEELEALGRTLECEAERLERDCGRGCAAPANRL